MFRAVVPFGVDLSDRRNSGAVALLDHLRVPDRNSFDPDPAIVPDAMLKRLLAAADGPLTDRFNDAFHSELPKPFQKIARAASQYFNHAATLSHLDAMPEAWISKNIGKLVALPIPFSVRKQHLDVVELLPDSDVTLKASLKNATLELQVRLWLEPKIDEYLCSVEGKKSISSAIENALNQSLRGRKVNLVGLEKIAQRAQSYQSKVDSGIMQSVGQVANSKQLSGAKAAAPHSLPKFVKDSIPAGLSILVGTRVVLKKFTEENTALIDRVKMVELLLTFGVRHGFCKRATALAIEELKGGNNSLQDQEVFLDTVWQSYSKSFESFLIKHADDLLSFLINGSANLSSPDSANLDQSRVVWPHPDNKKETDLSSWCDTIITGSSKINEDLPAYSFIKGEQDRVKFIRVTLNGLLRDFKQCIQGLKQFDKRMGEEAVAEYWDSKVFPLLDLAIKTGPVVASQMKGLSKYFPTLDEFCREVETSTSKLIKGSETILGMAKNNYAPMIKSVEQLAPLFDSLRNIVLSPELRLIEAEKVINSTEGSISKLLENVIPEFKGELERSLHDAQNRFIRGGAINKAVFTSIEALTKNQIICSLAKKRAGELIPEEEIALRLTLKDEFIVLAHKAFRASASIEEASKLCDQLFNPSPPPWRLWLRWILRKPLVKMQRDLIASISSSKLDQKVIKSKVRKEMLKIVSLSHESRCKELRINSGSSTKVLNRLLIDYGQLLIQKFARPYQENKIKRNESSARTRASHKSATPLSLDTFEGLLHGAQHASSVHDLLLIDGLAQHELPWVRSQYGRILTTIKDRLGDMLPTVEDDLNELFETKPGSRMYKDISSEFEAITNFMSAYEGKVQRIEELTTDLQIAEVLPADNDVLTANELNSLHLITTTFEPLYKLPASIRDFVLNLVVKNIPGEESVESKGTTHGKAINRIRQIQAIITQIFDHR